eukprot:6209741-Pleurochrysis_carterae.AAC.3
MAEVMAFHDSCRAEDQHKAQSRLSRVLIGPRIVDSQREADCCCGSPRRHAFWRARDAARPIPGTDAPCSKSWRSYSTYTPSNSRRRRAAPREGMRPEDRGAAAVQLGSSCAINPAYLLLLELLLC